MHGMAVCVCVCVCVRVTTTHLFDKGLEVSQDAFSQCGQEVQFALHEESIHH